MHRYMVARDRQFPCQGTTLTRKEWFQKKKKRVVSLMGCSKCQLVADMNSCPGRMGSLQDIHTVVGVPKLSWHWGLKRWGVMDQEFNPKLETGYYLNVSVCMHAQLCLIVCNPMGYNPPGSSVLGIFQARILSIHSAHE